MRQIAYLVGIVAAIAFAAHQAFAPARAGQLAVFVWMGVPTVTIAAIGTIRAVRDGVAREWFGVRAGDFTRGFFAAAVLFAGSFAFTKMLKLPELLWIARLYEQLGEPAELRKKVSTMVLAIIVISVAEEIAWRGFVTSLLEEKIGTRRAWVVAALLYALAHVPTIWALKDPNAGLNPTLVLAALAAGLVWGFMARRFGRLVPGIFSHVLFDWTVMMMFRLWGPSV